MPADIGRQKATALCATPDALLGKGSATPIVADVLLATEPSLQAIDLAVAAADVVLDNSASVSVARSLSDKIGNAARKASALLNPIGTASALLLEDFARACRLDALEGQYYRLVMNETRLLNHPGAARQRLHIRRSLSIDDQQDTGYQLRHSAATRPGRFRLPWLRRLL